MGDLKRAEEMRIDEFSRNELGESHVTVQELQERKNFMNVSRKFQDIESICSGQLSHVPSHTAVVPSLELLRAATKACNLIHGICLGHKDVFGNPRAGIRFVIDFLSRNSSLLESKCYRWEPRARQVQGDLLRKVKNKLEAQFHCRVLQEDHQP